MRFWFILFLCLSGLAVAQEDAEVARAYQAIPHRYTAFPASTARMPKVDKAYIAYNFRLLNQAIVARVNTLQNRDFDGYEKRIAEILELMELKDPPRKLKEYHQLVIEAVKDQRDFFRAWKHKPGAKFDPKHPKVQAASAKLRKAYGILQQKFPKQPEEVHNAFFDHLCALDFI